MMTHISTGGIVNIDLQHELRAARDIKIDEPNRVSCHTTHIKDVESPKLYKSVVKVHSRITCMFPDVGTGQKSDRCGDAEGVMGQNTAEEMETKNKV